MYIQTIKDNIHTIYIYLQGLQRCHCVIVIMPPRHSGMLFSTLLGTLWEAEPAVNLKVALLVSENGR